MSSQVRSLNPFALLGQFTPSSKEHATQHSPLTNDTQPRHPASAKPLQTSMY